MGEICERGIDAYQRHLGVRPVIFGRRRFGLSPLLPQILEKFGFQNVLHATLDDGRFPSGDKSRIRWEGLDGTSLEALARIPDDAGRDDCFLRLPQRLAKRLGFGPRRRRLSSPIGHRGQAAGMTSCGGWRLTRPPWADSPR